eukprot:gene10273-19978_t
MSTTTISVALLVLVCTSAASREARTPLPPLCYLTLPDPAGGCKAFSFCNLPEMQPTQMTDEPYNDA